MAYRLLHKKSSVSGKTPTSDQLEFGEIAINYNSNSPKIHIKDSEKNIVSFIDEENIKTLITNENKDIKEKIDVFFNDNPEINETIDTLKEIQTYFDTQGKDVTDLIETVNELKNNTQFINVTYDELISLCNNSQLTAYAKYRITDYVTSTIQDDTISALHPFDIVVEAISTNTLSEDAKAFQSSRDNGYFNNNKLESWEIKYCIINDDSRFAWADVTNGKGVIYYMKDEFNNEAWYDFKNIQFQCNGFEFSPFDPSYTFSDINGNDLSLTTAHDNIIKPYVINGKQTLNHTIFIGNNIHSNNIEENSFKNLCCVSGCYYNNIGRAFQENIISAPTNHNLISFHNNAIGNLFKKNRIQSTFNRNTIGNTTTSCDFFSSFTFNEIGHNSWNIDFNYPVSYCKFGSYIQYCVFNNTAQYPPIVTEMKWCTFGDGLEGAQYIPCCQKVTFEDRSLYNSEDNWHINDVILTDGTKLVEALIKKHEDQIYVCSVDGKCRIFKYQNLDILKENINLNSVKPIFSNPNLDFNATSNNANCYGYVGNLSDLNVQGDNILINSIGVYVREGEESPNKSTKVWCRLLKFINNEWVIIYQSDKSQSIEGIEPETLFTFTMVSQIDDALIKFNDKIAITYVDNPTSSVNSGIQLGFKTINKPGGLQNPLNINSTGSSDWCPAFVFGYIPTSSIQNELYLGEFNDINNVYNRISQSEIYTNTNITRITFTIKNDYRTNANGYIDQFITGGPYTINGVQYYYVVQIIYWDGTTCSRQISYTNNGSPSITNWVKYIDHDDNGAPILYSKGSEVITVNNNQTINGVKSFNNTINLFKDGSIKTVISNNVDSGELKVLHNNSNKGFIIRTNNTSDDILPLEILSTNGDDYFQYNFPKTTGNIPVGVKINETIYNAELTNGLIDLTDVFNSSNNLTDILNRLSNLDDIVTENEDVVAEVLVSLDKRIKELEEKINNLETNSKVENNTLII